MFRFAKRGIAVLLIGIFLSVAFTAAAHAQTEPPEKDWEVGKMAADAILARPIGIISTVLGGAVFIVSLPFSALGGNTGQAWDTLVITPARFTFKRPLGQF